MMSACRFMNQLSVREFSLPAGGEAMTKWILRLLQAMCIAVGSLIVIDIFVDVVKVGPPPVPLDKEGHMAPWSEDPGWDIPDLPDDSPSSRDATSR